MIEELVAKAGVPKESPPVDDTKELYSQVNSKIANKLYELKQIPQKQQRNDAVKELLGQIMNEYCPEGIAAAGAVPKYKKSQVNRVLQRIEEEVVRKLLLEGKRLDGRGYKDLRPISCEVGLLPRTGGMVSFTLMVVILTALLYKPIQRVLAERRDRIAKSMADVDAAREAAARAQQDYDRHIAEAQRKAQEIIGQAAQAGEKVRAEIEARHAA